MPIPRPIKTLLAERLGLGPEVHAIPVECWEVFHWAYRLSEVPQCVIDCGGLITAGRPREGAYVIAAALADAAAALGLRLEPLSPTELGVWTLSKPMSESRYCPYCRYLTPLWSCPGCKRETVVL